MNKKIPSYIIISILILFLIPVFAHSQENSTSSHKLIIFYSPACHKCFEVRSEVIPEIQEEFKNRLEVEYCDISDIENYKLLLSLQEKHKTKIKNILPVFYLGGNFLNSQGQIKRELKSFILRALATPVGKREDLQKIDLIMHFKTFEPFVIISAGLIDGINPCAFTVIVFFISFLALRGYKKRELITIGLTFVFTVFLTYLLIGLGLFGFFYRLKGFWILVRIFNLSVGIFSIILGLLCVYDFFKFRKTKETEGLILQLPKAIKDQIHKVIGLHYRVNKPGHSGKGVLRTHIFRLFLSAFITGFLVSILEAVCTGQVYLPTITFVLKVAHLKIEALGYLLLYNFMFIVPLILVFLFGLLGVTSEQFSRFLKKHLLTVKIIMAILFFGLGIFLIWRA